MPLPILLLLLLATATTTSAASCSTGEYDLSPFDNSGDGYVVTTTEYKYTVAVCDPLTSSVCGTDVGLCQEWGNSESKLLGMTSDLTMAELVPSGSGVAVTMGKGAYSGTCEKENSAVINFKCDQGVTTSTYTFTFVGTVECVSTLEISHCQACPGGCTNGPSPPSSSPPPPPSSGPPSPPHSPPPPGSVAPSAGPPKKTMDATVKLSLIIGGSLAAAGILGCLLAIRLRFKIAAAHKAHTVTGDYRPLSSSSDNVPAPRYAPPPPERYGAADNYPGPFSASDDSADAGGALFDADKAAERRASTAAAAPDPATAAAPAAASAALYASMPQVECPGCASLNSDRARYCAACGGDMSTGKKRKFLPMDTSLMAKFDRYGRALPKGWRMGEDARGKPFYYHTRTHERTSKRPRHSDSSRSRSRSRRRT